METSLLRTIANAILTSIEGPGRWLKQGTRPEFKKIDNPLLGLSSGDVVYYYSEDKEELVEDRVLTVVDGVGYVFVNQHYYGPTLLPIDSEVYATTREGAVELWRSDIASDIAYIQGKVDKLAGLKSLLEPR